MTAGLLFAGDLDRTLIHPRSRLPAARADAVVTVEIYEGREITVASRATLAGLAELCAQGVFVPATTRSRAQLARVEPVWAMARSGWAICANGGILLDAGRDDREWADRTRALCGDCAGVDAAERALLAAVGPADPDGWLLRLRRCEDRFLYAVCDLAKMPAGTRDAADDAVAGLGWQAVGHGRKLYVLPRPLTKLACAEHLRDRLGRDVLLAAGDSELDASLLAAADAAWCPRDAELVATGTVPAGVRVTRGVHVDAAEEIVQSVAAMAAAATTSAVT